MLVDASFGSVEIFEADRDSSDPLAEPSQREGQSSFDVGLQFFGEFSVSYGHFEWHAFLLVSLKMYDNARCILYGSKLKHSSIENKYAKHR